MYCCQSPVGTMAGRGISRAFGIGTGKKSQAGGGSRRSGRGTRQGRLSFLEQKGLDRPIPPSVGEGGGLLGYVSGEKKVHSFARLSEKFISVHSVASGVRDAWVQVPIPPFSNCSCQ